MNVNSKGMLVNDMKGGSGRLDMLLCFSSLILIIQSEMDTISATPSTYPATLPSIFCFFLEGALRLADPYLPFLFFGFFFCFSIYFYPYFFQGPRLSCWEPFFLYLNYLSAKIKQFGQTPFSILQLQI